jgi:hypothetical protein
MTRRDQGAWAKPVSTLVGEVPAGAVNLNVTGRTLSGAAGGFGRLWQKTFRAALVGVQASPREVVSAWKENFEAFWGAKGSNRFYWGGAGIAPGQVGVINSLMRGAPTVATGVLVVYADEESFSFMTPQGHPFTGIITFSAYEEDGITFAQVQEFIRASDPLWEIGMAVGLGRMQNRTWQDTLRNVAAHFGVTPEIETRIICVDRRRQWSNARNIRQNAAVHSTLYAVSRPFRWLRR